MLQCKPYLSPVVSGHATHVVVYALHVPGSQWARHPCCSVRLTCPRQLVGTPPMLQCTPYLSPVVSEYTTYFIVYAYLSPVVSGQTPYVIVYSLPFPCSQWAHHPCCSVGLTCHLQLVDTPPMLQCRPYLSPVVSGYTTYVVVYALPVPGCAPPMLQCTPYLFPVVSGHSTHVVVYALPVPGSQWTHHPCCSVRLTCFLQLVGTPPCCSVRLTCPRQLVDTPPMLQCTPYLSPVVSGHTPHVVVYALPVPGSQWTHPPCCSVRLTCPRQLVGAPPISQCTPYLSRVVSGHTPYVIVYALPVPWAHHPCCSVRLTCPLQLVGTPPMLQCTPYLSPVVSEHTPYFIVYALVSECLSQ